MTLYPISLNEAVSSQMVSYTPLVIQQGVPKKWHDNEDICTINIREIRMHRVRRRYRLT